MAQKTIKIKVLTSDSQHVGDFKELYRNSLVIDDSVSFDYALIERALMVLYPKSMVQFLVGIL